MPFPSDDDVSLQETVSECLRLLVNINSWISKFAPQREATPHCLTQDLSYQILERHRTLENVRVAASVPAALAVYGASQSGKSLFIGTLLQDEDADGCALGLDEADADQFRLDFVKHLNPAHGVEATAVVTRFTLGARLGVPENLRDTPVRARIFSRCDIIKALGRGFLTECRGEKEWTEQAVEALISRQIEPQYPCANVDPGWRADLVEAFRFLKEEMGHHNLKLSALSFSQFLLQHPLTDQGYIELCSHLFWENWRAISGLFANLHRMREETLDNAEFIQIPWSAVRFVLDSTRPDSYEAEPFGSKPVQWQRMVLKANEETPILQYGTRGGKKVALDLLQALISELQIPLVESRLSGMARELFSRGDCLDIPGAVTSSGRAGWTLEQFSNEVKGGASPELLVVKRGKVGLLFEKYAQEQQASVLLYLQAKGNLDARSELPPQILNWGRSRFGRDWPLVLNRGEEDNPSLFVGLTKVDELLKLEAGIRPFDEFVGSQLAGHFSEWMHNYGGVSRAFRNVYLIRYPGVLDSKNPDKEIAQFDTWHQSFLRTPSVEKHVRDPEQNWIHAMSPDGGVSYLLGAIVGKVDNCGRREILRAQAQEAISAAYTLMSGHWVDPSFQAEVRRRRRIADKVVTWLEKDRHGERSRFLIQTLACDSSILKEVLESQLAISSLPVPEDPDFDGIVALVLRRWAATRRWQGVERVDGQEDDFIRYTSYLCDYLLSCCAGEMAAKFAKLYGGVLADQRTKTMIRYGIMTIDDFILTPGPREEMRVHGPGYQAHPFQLLAARYQQILADRLASAIKEAAVVVPSGNDELALVLAGGEKLIEGF